MIDYHCHLLPGLDDGPLTMDESVRMAKKLRSAGYSVIHCTPHLLPGTFEAPDDLVRMTLVALKDELARQQVDLRLLPGREYYLDEFLPDYLNTPMTLGDTRFLLIEIPNQAQLAFVMETCYRITCSGYTPMIAHPERCALFAPLDMKRRRDYGIFRSWFGRSGGDEPGTDAHGATTPLLDYLVGLGCAFQGNLGSFCGKYGERVRRSALRLREMGIYTHFGTDLHTAADMDQLPDFKNNFGTPPAGSGGARM